MPSLTPASRNQATSGEAMQEGLVAGAFVLVPSAGVMYIAMQHSPLVRRLNYQARTAIVIMPALFTFTLVAEKYVERRMKEIAEEEKMSKWSPALSTNVVDNTYLQRIEAIQNLADQELSLMTMNQEQDEAHIVPGDTLQLQHRMANFVASNPVTCLAGLAVPSVALIFYGRTGQEHLQMSMKLLHTRVFGQFTTISLMLGIMGFKDYMDKHGLFITEFEVQRRQEEMRAIRASLVERLDYEQVVKEEQARTLQAAHDQTVQKKQQAAATEKAADVVVTSPDGVAALTATSSTN